MQKEGIQTPNCTEVLLMKDGRIKRIFYITSAPTMMASFRKLYIYEYTFRS
jgi:hypothetical protein